MTQHSTGGSFAIDQSAGELQLVSRALLLDMDGTLVNSDAVVERVWSTWAVENGLEPAEVLRVTHGRQPHASLALLLPDRPLAQNLADERRFHAQELADMDGVVAVRGAAALLAALRDLAVPHALVTSANAPLARARMAAAALPLPPVIVTAERVRTSKPDPEGFVLAARELGCAPADCIVFEDSAAGIAAGVAAGMRVIGVGPRAQRTATIASVATLEQVRIAAGPDGVRVRIAHGA
jgi:sugar-phosphatase